MLLLRLLLLCWCVLSAGSIDRAMAQDANCRPYQAATTGTPPAGVPIVPDNLLQNMNVAIPCLIKVIAGLHSNVTSPALSGEVGSRLLSATAAIRAIMARQTALDAKSGPGKTDNLNEFIKLFRSNDGIDLVSVLSYAARSEVYDARLNSVLILGNIIDNTTVCVPIAHLNDPDLEKTDSGKNGRANLLGVISVVAPWAYRENYDAISTTYKAVSDRIVNDPDSATTQRILDNIRKRLDSQDVNSTNASIPLPAEFRAACKAYLAAYRPKLPNLDSFKY